ncbi:MAG: hypothetical protein M0D55_04460 [Elusimicrobiota bacterium]|nr:MAG: hypothetical protein M0D55_04460 [Elusimicrobiota bacterium]
MTMNILIAVLALLPMTAAAQGRDSGSLLRGSMHALGQAGFAGMADIAMPQAPSAPSVSLVAAPVTETAQAIVALVDAVKKIGIDGSFSGAVLRKVGLAFVGETYPFKVIKISDPDVRNFTVTAVRGQNDILLEAVKKVDGKKHLRSYLISADGKLLGAAVSWKENGLILTESIPLVDAEADYREQLDYWMRYYRANLKKP